MAFEPTNLTQSISLWPGVSLYKQPLRHGGGSPNWYARVYLPAGGRDYHVKSTRTTDIGKATRCARDFFAECQARLSLGWTPGQPDSARAPDSPARFDRVADQWLASKKREAGAEPRKLRAYKDAKKLVLAPNGLGAFFRRDEVGSITTDRIREYLQFAVDRSKKGQLADTTKRNHLTVLSTILRFAHEKRLLSGVPPFPRMRVGDNPRACFSGEEYRLLWRCAGGLARHYKREGDEKAAADMLELRDFIIFMVGTFLRPSEWRELRQRHVFIHKGPHPHLEITVINGKTRKRKVVSMLHVVGLYERKLKRDGVDPERFLFRSRYQNRQTAYDSMADGFERLLEETGLTFDEFGKKRVMYSLRHTALMLRLVKGDGVDLLTLARNAGTSVNQLERFYLSHLDPAMKIANLQSFRVPVRPRSSL